MMNSSLFRNKRNNYPYLMIHHIYLSHHFTSLSLNQALVIEMIVEINNHFELLIVLIEIKLNSRCYGTPS